MPRAKNNNGEIWIRMQNDPGDGTPRDLSNSGDLNACKRELLSGTGWLILKDGMKGNRKEDKGKPRLPIPSENAVR